ncbi:cytochrome c oxidase subunit I [Nitratidesulfovibrio vulgaris]|uniref:Cytochrome c oxidase subunit 1 n=1 Tax=Nitratidesulfovibrio vulgaris (strain DP4) TaxID=391774 RepID=A0A0H3A7T9_NITV4|nr:cytochrome c oxidase subunit I [Nitratidesulfovibrio vulgaris]ABM28363.1 Cytochrome-c oxidase [Nitratidesulfovibrio vulgaris DP4]GEB79475.1 cytochrome c oxidase subunit 1 [Desulfovibrio desulfuricans]HBW15417.1 cytochrome c oxidase subunit I [Desulfovibrio sp.]
MSEAAHTSVSFLRPMAGTKGGIASWLFSTDHKRIGIMYLCGIMGFFLVGLLLGFLVRLELIAPGPTIMDAQTYNTVFTLHGVIMIFLVVIPSIPAAFGNIILPIQIGAEDVSFPKLNNFSFWLYVIGALMALSSLFTGKGGPDTGWTFYVPFSQTTSTNVSAAVLAVFVLGFSSILTGLNFITTIHRLRAPGMTWDRLPLFVWSLYATGWIQVLATPVLGITVLLIFAERVLGVGLFDPSRGGDPLLYQHLFWIYSHPAVYIMILPAMGVISDILPVFARKNIFGYKMIALSSLAIAFAGSLVWAHHMFTSGMSDTAVLVFSFLTFVVAIPSAIKVFNWVSTLYKGSIRIEPPLWYALAFIFLFSIGGLTGLVLGSAGTDIHVHDTYFVVAHFHYVIFGGLGFGLFGAMHYWFPKIFGRMYDKKTATLACFITFVGFNVLYFPMFVIGMQGMPRRYYDYLPQYTTGHFISTMGSWVLAAGILLMFWNLWRGSRNGPAAGDNPWGGATLEWSVSSPPPHHNFVSEPVVTKGPYDFTGVKADG